MKFNWKRISVHLLFWVLYLIVWGVRDMAYAPTFWDTIDSNVIGSLVYAAGVYFNIYILVPQLLLKNRKLGYTLSVVLLVLVVAVVTAQAFAYYYQSVHMDTSRFFASIQGIANTGGDFLVVYGLATCLYFINEWYIKERRLRELETQNLKAELDMLKGQINPHFLFNALNSVHVLIRKNPEKARSTLEKFSELLSHQIYEVNKELVSLKDEVDNLANFIELQKLRFEDHTKISWKVNGNLKDKQIAPMLFLNFVENAFKYGVAPEDQPVKVDILLNVSDQLVTFSCINSVTDVRQEGNTLGVGLANVRRRLEILYPKRHTLEIEQKKDTYSVHLELNLHEN
jgi:sensor histidine kinase YesM